MCARTHLPVHGLLIRVILPHSRSARRFAAIRGETLSSKVNLHLAELNLRSMALIGLTFSYEYGAEASGAQKRRRGR